MTFDDVRYTFHDNGWTVIIDEDIKQLTDLQLKTVCRLIVAHTVVVFKNQSLTPNDEIRIVSAMGDYQKTPEANERFKHIRVNEGILRVTGQKNQYGEEGLFGHKETLDWHANQPSNPDRMPLIWIYGVEGTEGSRTSWINNILAYEDLSDDMKQRLENIYMYCGYKSGRYSTTHFFHDHVNAKNPIKLVQTNKEGKKGLFFPFYQIFQFKDVDNDIFLDIMEELKDHVLNEKYMYHHDWKDGDLVISEQWLGIHKRWAFEHMERRVVHRIAFDYSKVYNA